VCGEQRGIDKREGTRKDGGEEKLTPPHPPPTGVRQTHACVNHVHFACQLPHFLVFMRKRGLWLSPVPTFENVFVNVILYRVYVLNGRPSQTKQVLHVVMVLTKNES
jgi:hypothetical protein